MSVPPGDRPDCGPTALLHRGHLEAWNNVSKPELLDLDLTSSNLLQCPLLSIKTEKYRESTKPRKRRRLQQKHIGCCPCPASPFPPTSRSCLQDHAPTAQHPLPTAAPRCQPTGLLAHANASAVPAVTGEHTRGTLSKCLFCSQTHVQEKTETDNTLNFSQSRY